MSETITSQAAEALRGFSPAARDALNLVAVELRKLTERSGGYYTTLCLRVDGRAELAIRDGAGNELLRFRADTHPDVPVSELPGHRIAALVQEWGGEP